MRFTKKNLSRKHHVGLSTELSVEFWQLVAKVGLYKAVKSLGPTKDFRLVPVGGKLYALRGYGFDYGTVVFH